MSPNSRVWTYVAAVAIIGLALVSHSMAMSIEAEPVKVTHRNSGPRYDIDELERAKQASANQERPSSAESQAAPAESRPPPPPPSGGESQEGAGGEEVAAPIGHVAIRRIFLFPMMRPGDWSQQDSGAEQQSGPQREIQGASRGEQEADHEPMPSMFAKPFWPFLTPARPSPASHQDHERPHRPHLFGADEASRPAAGEPDQDKAASNEGRERDHPMGSPVFDPIQMMVDLMHQAINSQLAPSNFATDLSKGTNNRETGATSGDNNNNNSPAPEASDERPLIPSGLELFGSPALRPQAKNETREDIVEIEGKKYLRKTVTNRHVGDNIVFMTRRLIFVPLNETDATTTTDTVATTTTDSPATAASESEAPAVPTGIFRVDSSKPTSVDSATPSTTTTTTTTTSAAPTTTAEPTTASPTTAAPSSEQPKSTTTESTEESTTPAKSSWVERASEASGKAAERLVEDQNVRTVEEPAGAVTAPSGSQ